MLQLRTDGNDSHIALAPGIEGNEGCGDTVYLTIFYVPEQPELLSFSEKLCENDVGSVR